MKLPLLIAAVCLFINSSSATEIEKNFTQVRFGLFNFQPFFNCNENYVPEGGVAVDAINKIFEESDISITYECLTPSRLFKNFELGTIDLTIAVIPNSNLSNNHTIVKVPFMEMEIYKYSHRDAILDNNNTSIAATVKFDYFGQRKILERSGYVFYDLKDNDSAIKFFIHKRSQHLITYNAVFDAFLTKNNLNYQSLMSISLKKITAVIVISGKSKNSKELIAFFDKYLMANRCDFLINCF